MCLSGLIDNVRHSFYLRGTLVLIWMPYQSQKSYWCWQERYLQIRDRYFKLLIWREYVYFSSPSFFPFLTLFLYLQLICVSTCLAGDILKSGLIALCTLLPFSLCFILSYTCHPHAHTLSQTLLSRSHTLSDRWHFNQVWFVGRVCCYRATSQALPLQPPTHTPQPLLSSCQTNTGSNSQVSYRKTAGKPLCVCGFGCSCMWGCRSISGSLKNTFWQVQKVSEKTKYPATSSHLLSFYGKLHNLPTKAVLSLSVKGRGGPSIINASHITTESHSCCVASHSEHPH